MRDDTMDVLLRIGMPASAKGLTYICDAIELFDTDPYYPEGKICSLYNDIAHRHDTTSSRVEQQFATLLMQQLRGETRSCWDSI